MNKKEALDFYGLYRSFYAVSCSKFHFIESYSTEFSTIPYNLILAAFKNWQKFYKGCYPPTLMEIKDRLWRMKLIAGAKLRDDAYNRAWNEKMAGLSVEYFDDVLGYTVAFTREARPVLPDEKIKEIEAIYETLEKGLNGFNKSYEGG